MLSDIKERISKWLNHSGVGLVVPTLFFMLISHAFFWLSTGFMDHWTGDWFLQRHPLSGVVSVGCVPQMESPVCSRLIEQLGLATSRMEHHYEIGRQLQTWQFGFLSTAFWAGTILALGLFAVAKKGYDDLDAWGKGLLLGLTCAVAFFGGFPRLISMDQNISQNLNSYNAYDGITNQILTYMRTGKDLKGNPVEGAFFLYSVDQMFATLPAPRIQYDATQVEVGGLKFKEITQGYDPEAEPLVLLPPQE